MRATRNRVYGNPVSRVQIPSSPPELQRCIMHKKFYSIEFLRVWFLILIIIGHSKMQSAVVETFGNNALSTMGSRVNIFMLICGFFLFLSLQKQTNFWDKFKHRIWRILPVLCLYKILATIFIYPQLLPFSLSNLFILNQNIGIMTPTITHIIWYVDVMFWVYLLYLALFSFYERQKAIFSTCIMTLLSLMILFTNNNINLHFEPAYAFLDGGILRGIAFIGMGILLAALPNRKIYISKTIAIFATIIEIISLIMAISYPMFINYMNSGVSFNHVLWVALFVFLMTREYGWFSKKLNNCSWIYPLSKNCYEIYVFQLFAIMAAEKWLSPNQHPWLSILGMLFFAILLGKSVYLFYSRPIKKLHSKLPD